MSNIRHNREIPDLDVLPRPIYARPESWGDSGSITQWHHHPWGQFSYAISGVLMVVTQTGRYIAPPQFAIWVPASCSHKVISAGAAEMRSLYVQSPQLSAERWQETFVCQVTPLCRELIIRFCRQTALYHANSVEGRLADVLMDELVQLPRTDSELPMPSDPRIVKISQILQHSPDNQANIHQLGSQVGLSGRSVSRLFQKETGLNFQQWRQRLRLLTAISQLEGGQSVTQVALNCGYDSISAFVAAFKNQFHVTPGQFFSHDK